MVASRILAPALLAAFLLTQAAFATDITQCAQLVPSGHQGILLNDLVCSSAPGRCLLSPAQPCTTDGDCGATPPCVHAGVFLQGGNVLDLNGFSISGVIGDEPASGVFCNGTCTVEGPGQIAHVGFGITTDGRRARVTNVDIHDATNGGIGSNGTRLFLEGVTVTQVGAGGPEGGAVVGTRIRVIDAVTVSNNAGVGMRANRAITGSNLTVNGNGDHGIASLGPVRLTGLTANGNSGAGIAVEDHVRLVDSTLTGNNGGGAGIDVATQFFPVLVGTTCGKSASFILPATFGAAWGVCAGD